MRNKFSSGFTLLEILAVVGIVAILTTLGISTFATMRRRQAFEKDTETVVEVLSQARNQTLSSKNASQYGVHFATSEVTLFAGSAYATGTVGNLVFPLYSSDLILSVTLSGGGSDVIFDRLSGETRESGTVVVDVPSLSQTKAVTIYSTGIIESN